MQFEDILREVGDSGLYQSLLLYGFMFPCSVIVPWFSMASIFLTSSPTHWCNVPELVEAKISQEIQQKLISPPSDPSCSRYNINFTEILLAGDMAVSPDTPIIKCDKGWQYDKTNYDVTAVTKWDLVCEDDHYVSLILSLMFIGITFGTPITTSWSDKLGRKPAFFLMAFIIGVTEIGSCVSPYFWMLLVLRTINGTVVTAICSALFLILLEQMSPDLRARVNGITSAAWTLGLLFLPVFASATRHWWYLSAIVSTGAFGILFFWCYLTESPSWLISQGCYKEAAEIMANISRVNSKDAHKGQYLYQKICKYGEILRSEKIKGERGSQLDFFRYPVMRKRIILIMICWVCSCVPYYGHQINTLHLSKSEFYAYFWMALVEMPSNLFTWWMLQRFGRKWSQIVGFTIATVACIISAVLPNEYVLSRLVAALFGKAGSNSSYVTIYLQAPEMFPTPVRSMGVGLCSAVGTGATFFAPYIIYVSKFSPALPFYIFTTIAIIGLISSLFLPETLNEKLPQTILEAENFGKNQKILECCWRKSTGEYSVLLPDSSTSLLHSEEFPEEEEVAMEYIKKNHSHNNEGCTTDNQNHSSHSDLDKETEHLKKVQASV